MTPIPPNSATAIPILDSVTVSILALTKAVFRPIWRVNSVVWFTSSRLLTEECCGTRRTSSNVSAKGIGCIASTSTWVQLSAASRQSR